MREEGDGTDRRARAAARGKATRGWALACGAVLQRAGRRGAACGLACAARWGQRGSGRVRAEHSAREKRS